MELTLEERAWFDDPLWYKDAIIYQLHVKAFFDSSNDGHGDFAGLTQKLDYIQGLGVNAIWLLPFYPSPMRDDGYDISDYWNVNPEFGTLKDFRNFVREAHRRGLKVITELVVNHTSDQHPWFQAARKAPPNSAKRDFYVWSDTDKKFSETRVIFTDAETSNWAWDPAAQAYYWHRFFSHQPDLNHNNPRVVKAMIRAMRFWLDLGVDGLRLDAVPYLCVREGTNNENLPETHAAVKQFRSVIDAFYKNRMLLAEANQWPEDVRDYFGDGDECHMAYHFPLMPRMYMAVAQEDRHPITEIMRQTPDIPQNCQWAIFLRNHDELTLEMVTDRERDYMYKSYSADPRMRLNVGIRRRLAPLLDNELDKIKLMNSLLLSMPGTPIVYYGDEIGMGDNIFLGDRNGVRTPMQWSPDRNAGFSRADPQRLYLPPIMDPVYGYEAVNVESQSRERSSLLSWMRQLMGVRKASRSFSRGTLEFLRPGNRKILAYVREYENETVLCVANLSRKAQPVELDLSRFKARVPVEMMGQTPFPPVGDLPYLLTLPGYGFYWFQLSSAALEPAWHEERPAPAELPVLVLFEGWRSFFPEKVGASRKAMAETLRKHLGGEILPNFLPAQRWFSAKGGKIERIDLVNLTEWSQDGGNWFLAMTRVHCSGQEPQTCFLPLSIVWEGKDEERLRTLLPFTLAKVRQKDRVGLLCDAFADEEFCRALVGAFQQSGEIPFGEGRLKFSRISALKDLLKDPASQLTISRPGIEGSATAVIIGDGLFLKAYRLLQEGTNPELEMGRYLTEIFPYPHAVPLAGALEYQKPDGRSATLALLQGYVKNQGDVWSYTQKYLERFFEDSLVAPPEERVPPSGDSHGAFLMLMETLGRRTGELHQALSRKTDDPAFDPEPIGLADLSAWKGRVIDDALLTLGRLEQRLDALAEPARARAQTLLGKRALLLDRIRALEFKGLGAVKTRFHGDYHLGQVLLAESDFIIVGFEGEPARPVAERRAKSSPLRDVAGMLRSFDYAARAALNVFTALRPADLVFLEPLARDWQQRSAQAFLQGYEKTVKGCLAYPDRPEHAHSLIELFGLEKILYEIRYELDNRPEWTAVPLASLLEQLP